MIELNCKLTPSPDMVVLREISSTKVSAGGFYLSEGTLSNSRLGFYIVEGVGETAEKETCLKPGDYVYADRLASFYHTEPVCVMRWNNVVLITDKDKSELRSMPGWALAEELSQEEGKFVVAGEAGTIRKGRIRSVNWAGQNSKCPFKEGDVIMLSGRCDVFDGLDSARLVAVKVDDIVAKFDDEN